MFAPGIEEVTKDFNSSNPELASFIVSVYLLGFCFGPLVIAPISEMYGRVIIYNVFNIMFVVFTIACAVAPNIASLCVFRFLAGTAGSTPLTLGGGSIADMYRQETRGAAMAAWVVGPLVGPVIGPVGESVFLTRVGGVDLLNRLLAGGFLTQAKGWRWTFWVLSIAVREIFGPHSVRRTSR
jgi:MFS family permease